METASLRRWALLAGLTLVSLAPPAAAQLSPGRPDPQIVNCKIDLVDDVEMAATEAGVLDMLSVKEGTEVRAEDIIAKIDDRIAAQQRKVADYAWKGAKARAKDDVEIRFAQAASLVYRAEWEEMIDINRGVTKAVPEAEVRKARLEYDRATLQIEKAMHDMELARYEEQTKFAEFEASELAVERRQIRAPFDGQVVEVLRDEKEWVNPGDPIVRLVRLDTLQIDGFVYLDEYSPADLRDCKVTVEAPTTGGEVVRAEGRVVFINPITSRPDRPQMAVRAEISNRQENGEWVILPNQQANMTIHLGTGQTATGAR